jgi:hypothetical protein
MENYLEGETMLGLELLLVDKCYREEEKQGYRENQTGCKNLHVLLLNPDMGIKKSWTIMYSPALHNHHPNDFRSFCL